ncbi:PXA domain-containing protein [Bombardia bombarda]|uniref:PXA domain-containing protein n=1 Tax=Bombardia bombarda TaxID=252184 RepID=A0AA39WTV7_9PEZI|nr:PXA domain-containing protein [Bombardia bombarda]
MSCETRVTTLPCLGSGWRRVRREPEAVMICCSLVPENCPRRACVIVVGGWIVNEYRNMFEVAAMIPGVRRKPARLCRGGGIDCAAKRLLFIERWMMADGALSSTGFAQTSFTSKKETAPSKPVLAADDLFHSFTNSPIPEIRQRAAFIRQHGACPHPDHRSTRLPESASGQPAAETGTLPPKHVDFECPDCGIPVYCSKEHWADDYENHLEICDTLRQINEDDHDLRSGRYFPEFEYAETQLEEALINMTNWDTFLYTRGFNAINDDRSMRQATRLLTYPVTIASVLHELSPYGIRKEDRRITNEGLKSFSALRYTLHPPKSGGGQDVKGLRMEAPPVRLFILGARAESSLPRDVWTQLAHLFPRSRFHLIFIGPESMANRDDEFPLPPRTPTNPFGAIVEDRVWPTMKISTIVDYYHTLHKANYFYPYDPYFDCFIMFHPGLGHPASSHEWEETIPMLLETKAPVIVTGYTQADMERDIAWVEKSAAGEFDILMEPGENTFRSQRWDLNDMDPQDISAGNWGVWAFRGKSPSPLGSTSPTSPTSPAGAGVATPKTQTGGPTGGAARRGARTTAPDPLSDRATAFLVRRTLCSQHTDKGKNTSTSIEGLLPPLTSRNDVDLQLYALIAIILREYVQNWYNKITPDEAFVDEIVQIIAHCTRALEQRLRKVDLESLLLDELPDLVDKHVTTYRTAHRPVAQHPVETHPREIYHSLCPLPALSPVPRPEVAGSVVEQAKNEAAYRQLLVHGVLAILLPTEDLENGCLTALVGQIFSELIIGNSVANKLSQPWLIWELLIIVSRIVGKRKAAGSEDGDGNGNGSLSKTPQTSAPMTPVDGGWASSFQVLFWTAIHWCFLATSYIRVMINILVTSRSLPPRACRSIDGGENTEDSTHHTTEVEAMQAKTPILAFRCWSAVSNLIEMDVRMPWLCGALSILQWVAMSRPGRMAGVDGMIDR